MKTYLTFLFMIQIACVLANDINTEISQQISAIRAGSFPKYRALEPYISKDPGVVLEALAPYRTDASDNVRQWTYEQYDLILMFHEKPKEMRRDIVLLLIDGISDPCSFIRNDCVDYLTECKRQDFTPLAIEQFSNLFNSRVWFSKEFVLLAGFIGNVSCLTTLRELANSSIPGQRRLIWHANLALARMGDSKAEEWCLKQIDRIGINDDVTSDLLPGLIYTRQIHTFEFLIQVLNSDEKLCASSNPESDESILCGYRVMEYLAPVIKGYPLKQLPSGDIDTNDYHKALLTTRDWFAKKKGGFEILTDSF